MSKQSRITLCTLLYIWLLFNSCVYISLDKQKGPNDLVDPNIKSGIIFHLGTPGPLVRNEYTVKCYLKYAGSMVKEAKMKWNSRSSLELSPGDYIIESYVIYFGKKIWKSETEIKIRDEELVNYQFNPPVLVTSKPTIELN